MKQEIKNSCHRIYSIAVAVLLIILGATSASAQTDTIINDNTSSVSVMEPDEELDLMIDREYSRTFVQNGARVLFIDAKYNENEGFVVFNFLVDNAMARMASLTALFMDDLSGVIGGSKGVSTAFKKHFNWKRYYYLCQQLHMGVRFIYKGTVSRNPVIFEIPYRRLKRLDLDQL